MRSFTKTLSICGCSAPSVKLGDPLWPHQSLSLLTPALVPLTCSVNNRLRPGAGHGGPGDPQAAAVGGLHRLHRCRTPHINLHVVRPIHPILFFFHPSSLQHPWTPPHPPCFLCLRFISNKYLLKHPGRDFDVEWGYAFDVHLNAFYPLLVILHFLQLFFINRESVLNTVFLEDIVP